MLTISLLALGPRPTQGPTRSPTSNVSFTHSNRNTHSNILTSLVEETQADMIMLRSAARAGLLRTNKALTGSSALSSSRFWFSSSDDSHDDFAPKRKVVEGEDDALKLIKDHVTQNRVMLYMKGNPSMPMCGFSAKVVGILQDEGADFSSVNVLDYPAIREGVKKFASWPTIPQLYVGGEFIGGCDIVSSMHESGELKEVLEESSEEK